MENNHSDPSPDEFLEQIFGLPNFPSAEGGLSPVDGSGLGPGASSPMMLQLSSGDGSGYIAGIGASGTYHAPRFPLGLSLEQSGGFLKPDEASGSGKMFGDGRAPTMKNVFHGHPVHTNAPAATHSPAMRPRVRARRGQATDPHSIAERVRRERIAERIRALQELVPSVNKSDRAAMLDEVVDYVKFLRLQVKVLSMSRLGGAGAVAPLVTELPLTSIEEEEGERNQSVWDKWSNSETEQQVAKLMEEENVGAAMQFLQSKALCIMPISLASAIYHSQPPDNNNNNNNNNNNTSSSSSMGLDVKSENNPPSLQ